MFYHKKIGRPQTNEEREKAEKSSVGIAVIGVVHTFIKVILICALIYNLGSHFASWFIEPTLLKTILSYTGAGLLAYGLMELSDKFTYMASVMIWEKTLKGRELDAFNLLFFVVLALGSSYIAMQLDAEGFSHFYMSQHTKGANLTDEGGTTMSAKVEREKLIGGAEVDYEATIKEIKNTNLAAINEINKAAAAAIKNKPWESKRIREDASAKVAIHKAKIADGAAMALTMKNQVMSNAWGESKKKVEKVEEGNKKEVQRIEKEQMMAKSAGLSLAWVLIPLLLVITICGARLDIQTGHVKTFSLKEAFYKKGAIANLVTNLGKLGNGFIARFSNLIAASAVVIAPKKEKTDVDIEKEIEEKKPTTLKSVARALNGHRDSDDEYDEEREWNKRLQKKNIQ